MQQEATALPEASYSSSNMDPAAKESMEGKLGEKVELVTLLWHLSMTLRRETVPDLGVSVADPKRSFLSL